MLLKNNTDAVAVSDTNKLLKNERMIGILLNTISYDLSVNTLGRSVISVISISGLNVANIIQMNGYKNVSAAINRIV